MHLQQNIIFLKKYNRLTYDEFAAKLGCNAPMLKSYTLRPIVPPIELLCTIADFAGITLDALVRTKLTEKNYLQIKTGLKDLPVNPLDLIEEGVRLLKASKMPLPKQLPKKITKVQL